MNCTRCECTGVLNVGQIPDEVIVELENDAQVWLERVGDGPECSVVIEDGQIRNPE